MTDWKRESCAARPLEIQEISPSTLMQRRNIVQVHHEAADGMPAYDSWECECRELTDAEYAIYKAEDAIAKAEYVAMMSDIDFGEE